MAPYSSQDYYEVSTTIVACGCRNRPESSCRCVLHPSNPPGVEQRPGSGVDRARCEIRKGSLSYDAMSTCCKEAVHPGGRFPTDSPATLTQHRTMPCTLGAAPFPGRPAS